MQTTYGSLLRAIYIWANLLVLDVDIVIDINVIIDDKLLIMNTTILQKVNWIGFPIILFMLSLLASPNISAQWNWDGWGNTANSGFTDYCIQVQINNNTNCTMTLYCDETADGQSIYNMGTISAGQSKSIQPSQFGAHVYCVNNQTGQQVSGIYANNCGNLSYDVNSGCTANNPGQVSAPTSECSNGTLDCSGLNTNINGYMYLGEFNGHVYYKRTSGDVEYWTAKNFAENLGGTLPVINSQAENDFLVNAVNGKFWIGLTDAGSEGNFHWTNGAPVNYTNWKSGEPNNQGPNSNNADYVRVLENGKWADDSDYSHYWTVVEIVCPCVETPPTPPTPPTPEPVPTCNLSVGLPPNQTICAGETMIISASAAGQNNCVEPINYMWSTGESTANIVVSQAGTYTVTATDCDNCVATNEINITVLNPQGGTVSNNGVSTICAGDNTPINVSVNNNSGSNNQWVITDTEGNILELPNNPPFDFSNAGPGTCLIWNLAFENGLTGAAVGNNALTDLNGCYNLSNSVEIVKEDCVEEIDLELSKTVNQTTVELGDEVVWTISISNQGPGIATGVSVTDALPQDVGVVNIIVSDGAFNPNNLTWNIGTLNVNQTETLEVTTTIDAVGTITNTAQVSSANEPDVDSTPNNDNGDQSEDDEDNASVTSSMPTALASLGNFTFVDEDQDGIQDANEPGLGNVVVKLFDANDLNNQIGQALTNNDGFYQFNDLDPALDYVVQFMMAPADYQLTTQSGNASAGVPNDSDAGNNGFTDVIDLNPGENDMTIDAGYFLPDTNPVLAGLGNFTFQDFDDNGMYDPSFELPLSGVQVLLYNATNLNTPIATTTTDDDGAYQFINLDPNLNYVVQFQTVDGFQRSGQVFDASTGDDDKNDADFFSGFTDVIDLEPGEFDATIDGGYLPIRSFIQIKLLLQGAAELASAEGLGKPSNTDNFDYKDDEEESLWLMNTTLVDEYLIPLEEPYGDMENYQHVGDIGGTEFIPDIDALLLLASGPKTPVDWVFVEFIPYGGNTATTKPIGTRSGLITRDGTVIDTNGSDKLAVNLPYGEYQIGIRHRNHLGVMTANPVKMGGTVVPSLDFTNPQFVTYGQAAQISLDGQTKALWAGDLDCDGRIIFQGEGNDVIAPFFKVLQDPNNTNSLTNFIKTGYDTEDCNMDRNTIFQGVNNEVDAIFYNVITHPLNSDANPNFIIEAQYLND